MVTVRRSPRTPVPVGGRRRPPTRHQRGHTYRTAVARHPWRTGVAVVVVTLLVGAGVSYARKLAQPGNETVSEKSVEWLRDNRLGPVVNFTENQWYRHHAPRVGGTPRAITSAAQPSRTPVDAGASAPSTTSVLEHGTAAPATAVRMPIVPVSAASLGHLPAPTPVGTPAPTPVAGEGDWVPLGSASSGPPGIYTTQIRPDAVHTSYLEVAVWMDPSIVRFRLHPGLEVPGGRWTTPSSVPAPIAGNLVAAFNGGFRMKDAQGGFYLDGTARPLLRDGAATLVIDQAGKADVVQWGRDQTMGPNVAAARQNLALIVDHGKLVPGLDENPGNRWGVTVGNKVFVWRSGVGVTAHGALVYVGGPSLSVKSLAETLRRVGAVRAMEMDINHAWVSFNSYRVVNHAMMGTKLLAEMRRPGTRYLAPDSRDFVTVSLRGPNG